MPATGTYCGSPNARRVPADGRERRGARPRASAACIQIPATFVWTPMTPSSAAGADRNAALAALLARTALADQAAFGELYRRTSSHLHAVALRILRNRAAAEEVLQEAYVS